MTISTIEIGGVSVVYEEYGSGETLLFIHGYPGRPQDFRWLVPHLPEYRLVMLALPGLDLTPLPKTPMLTIPERADFVFKFMDTLEINSCTVLAHSMGGVIGTELAHTHPQKIQALVLISSVGPFPYRAYRRSKPKLASFMFNETPLYFFLSPVMRFVFSIMGFPKGVSSEAMRYVIACAACISFDEHAENLSGLLQPVLSIWCADDPLIEPASFQALKKMIPLCAEMKFEAGGHNPQKKYATEVAQKIIGFVSSLKK